jgi:hypothetical protein
LISIVFQCKPLHGVFSRASRLSKEPNSDPDETIIGAAAAAVTSPKQLDQQLPSAASTPKLSEKLPSSTPKLPDNKK